MSTSKIQEVILSIQLNRIFAIEFCCWRVTRISATWKFNFIATVAAQDANMEMELCKNLIVPNIVLDDYASYDEPG